LIGLLGAGAAAVLTFQAVAWACTGTVASQTTVSPNSAEPGQTVSVGATGGALEPSSDYQLLLWSSSPDCHHSGDEVGGTALSTTGGNITPVNRTIPTTTTPGTRYLCWVLDGDPLESNSVPVAITIF
jgi:hypothetical protein